MDLIVIVVLHSPTLSHGGQSLGCASSWTLCRTVFTSFPTLLDLHTICWAFGPTMPSHCETCNWSSKAVLCTYIADFASNSDHRWLSDKYRCSASVTVPFLHHFVHGDLRLRSKIWVQHYYLHTSFNYAWNAIPAPSLRNYWVNCCALDYPYPKPCNSFWCFLTKMERTRSGIHQNIHTIPIPTTLFSWTNPQACPAPRVDCKSNGFLWLFTVRTQSVIVSIRTKWVFHWCVSGIILLRSATN